MKLERYKEKRSFEKTPEPSGEEGALNKKNIFVVQRHDASHLHFDFRLERDGVLKSWAVPKGPSTDPSVKRLAVEVEDHPLEYAKFHGRIPEGNYGAGKVEIWDHGTYTTKFSDDSLWEFKLKGKKLKGMFSLIKIRNKGKYLSSKPGKDNSWLLIKTKDELVEPVHPKDIAHSKKMPHDIKPMLATLIDKPFNKKGWIFEIKWDGYRAISEIENGKALLYSRNHQPFEDKFPIIFEALKGIPHDAVLDGEVVVLDKSGKPSFQKLQYYSHEKEGELIYYVFDILYLDGEDLQKKTLRERKEVLAKIIPKKGPIVLNEEIEGQGESFFQAAKEQGLEGVIAKDAESSYRQGIRGPHWLKIKTHQRQEAVICGFTKPKGNRENFGALILGVYKGKKLHYIGGVGSGFDDIGLQTILKILSPLIRKTSPFHQTPDLGSGLSWVEPKIVCEIKFQEWTRDGLMRQPIFMGLREDKLPAEVQKEEVFLEQANFFGKGPTKSDDEDSLEVIIDKQKLQISHPNKVFWPEDKISKIDLIQYYREISPFILPYLKDRPESLKRYPDGITGESFFHKNIEIAPDWVKTIEISSADKKVNYLLCQNEPTLIYLINLGCIDLNPWNSSVANLDNPDYLIIDLDPHKTSFKTVVTTALGVREILEGVGIASMVKTSGATGMHIYIPLGAKYDYEQTRQFAQLIAIKVNKVLPQVTSLERSPEKREGKVYLDVFQNARGQTLAAPYSVRAMPGATVSTPLDWSEVNMKLTPQQFTMKNVVTRLNKIGDIFKPVLGKGIDIESVLKKELLG
jgi:bifunctional non-homologous end joining protein LigD